MMADFEFKIIVKLDMERFVSEFSKRVALGSASDFESVQAEMLKDIGRFVKVESQGDVLDDEIIQ